MSYLPQSKYGNCSRCPAKDTACKKRGKDLVCLNCCRTEDSQKQISKAKLRDQKRQISSKVRSLHQSDSNIEVKERVEKTKSELDKWFDMVATFIKANPHCENCGEWISEKYYRHASAHIVAKSLFPSVATHPLNFLILSASCGCHSEYDGSIEKAAKMQIWDKAVDRFLKFESEIKEKHKYLDLFREHIPISKIKEND